MTTYLRTESATYTGDTCTCGSPRIEVVTVWLTDNGVGKAGVTFCEACDINHAGL